MSILGTFDGVCLLCGGVAIEGFSTATSPMMYKAVVLQMRSLYSGKGNKIWVSGSCQNRATLTGKTLCVLAWKRGGSLHKVGRVEYGVWATSLFTHSSEQIDIDQPVIMVFTVKGL